jgi:hypothetical protein
VHHLKCSPSFSDYLYIKLVSTKFITLNVPRQQTSDALRAILKRVFACSCWILPRVIIVNFIVSVDSFVSCFSLLQGTLHNPLNQDF